MKKYKYLILTVLVLFLGFWIVNATGYLSRKNNVIKTNIKYQPLIKANHSKKAHHLLVDEDDDGLANYVNIDSVLLFVNSGIMKLTNITPSTAKQIYGNPKSETMDYADIDEKDMLVYTYQGGKIYFIDDRVCAIECLDEGFGLQFIKRDGGILLQSAGSDVTDVYNIFNSSYSESLGKGVTIFLKAHSGKKTESTVNFQFTNDVNSNVNANTISSIVVELN